LTDQAIRVVPAGWYEDPASSAHVRWWNGLAWTEHTTLKPTAPPRPQPVATQPAEQTGAQNQQGHGYLDAYSQRAETVTTSTGSVHTAETLARIAEARELERQYGISTAEHDVIVQAATAGAAEEQSTHADTYVDTGPTRAAHRALQTATDDYDSDDERTSTASAWFIALWPLLTLVVAVAVAYVYFYVTPGPVVAGIPLLAGVLVVPLLLTLIWAVTDARKLRQRGHRPASPALALLGPLVYLIGRRTRVTGSGPLVTLILLTLAVVGGPTAAYLTGAAAPITKALEIQQTVRADLVDGGQLASVSCPVLIESINPGTLYSCDGTLPDGSAKRVWVSIEDSDGTVAYALDVR
jgi:hypothetical protein